MLEGAYASVRVLQKRFVAAAGKRATVYMQPGGHGISRQASRMLEAWLVDNL